MTTKNDVELTQEELHILVQLLDQVNVKLEQAPVLLRLREKLQKRLSEKPQLDLNQKTEV